MTLINLILTFLAQQIIILFDFQLIIRIYRKKIGKILIYFRFMILFIAYLAGFAKDIVPFTRVALPLYYWVCYSKRVKKKQQQRRHKECQNFEKSE